MLHDRGFDHIVEYDLESADAGLILTGTAIDRVQRVHMCMEDRVGVKFARTVIDASAGDDACIIVSIDGPTPFTRKECSSVQFFTAIDLCRNITHHCLVPRHRSIDATDLPPGMEAGRLPRLLDTDRVAQYYNWPRGTIVHIKRVFGGNEPIEYFRVVSSLCGNGIVTET